jgi:hypothetical protein
MNAHRIRIAAIAAALIAASTLASSSAGADPSPLALPASTLNLVESPGLPEVSFEGVSYRPRRTSGNWGRHVDASGVSQIHVGFYDPDGDAGQRFLIGARGGPMIDPHVQLGVGVDWAHRTDNVSSVSRTTTGPGGVPITTSQPIARASTNFFPIMGYIQVSADDNMSVIPYFGAGVGYQLMGLSADDFSTGNSFDATYGGWGWQLWGGAALPLSGRSRVTGEIFINNAQLDRDVTDDATGITYRESVNANGAGLRVGLAWGF